MDPVQPFMRCMANALTDRPVLNRDTQEELKMFCPTVFRLTEMIVVSTVLYGCGGLDGIRGTVIAVDGNHPRYIVRDLRGQEWHIWTDGDTRRDPVVPGDEVRVYTSKDGRAAYIQKLNP